MHLETLKCDGNLRNYPPENFRLFITDLCINRELEKSKINFITEKRHPKTNLKKKILVHKHFC